MTMPWYSDEEIAHICQPLTQEAAKARFLRETYGLHVLRRKNGKVLLMRAHAEAVLGGDMAQRLAAGKDAANAPKHEPNEAALIDFLAAKRAKRAGK